MITTTMKVFRLLITLSVDLLLATHVAGAWQVVPSPLSGESLDFERCSLRHNSRRHVLETFLSSAVVMGSASSFAPPEAVAVALPTRSKINDQLSQRLEASILEQPTPSLVPDELYGVDNFVYPSFLEGTWNVTQTLVNVETPLGIQYLGGPNGVLSIAETAVAESKRRLNVPVSLQLRYVAPTFSSSSLPWSGPACPTAAGVVMEDRVFNTRQRLNAFAGKSVVASVDYADVGASNRAKVLALGGSNTDPLSTTLVRFKGPAAQKTFLTAHTSSSPCLAVGSSFDDEKPSWTGSESQRSIFALTNENTAPPIFTDTESIWQFTRINDQHVQGRLRIASYLNAQQDKLYFSTRNRAVSLLDYTLDMIRV